MEKFRPSNIETNEKPDTQYLDTFFAKLKEDTSREHGNKDLIDIVRCENLIKSQLLTKNNSYREIDFNDPKIFAQFQTIILSGISEEVNKEQIANDFMERIQIQIHSNNLDKEYNK